MRVAAWVVLGFLAMGGAVGGILFLADPSGAAMGMRVDELPPWPLADDFTWPGVLLLVAFCAAPLAVAAALAVRPRLGFALAAVQGVVLVGWMIVQIVGIGLLAPPMQVGFLGIGLALVALGTVGVVRMPVAAGRHRA